MECQNEEDLDLNQIVQDSPDLFVISEEQFNYCFVIDQLYNWIQINPINPYTRRSIPEDVLNEIRAKYNQKHRRLIKVESSNGKTVYQIHDHGQEDYIILVDTTLENIVEQLFEEDIRPEQINEAIQVLENAYQYYTYDQTEQEADQMFGHIREYNLSKQLHHAETNDDKANVIRLYYSE